MKVYLCDGIKYRPILDDELTLYIVSVPHLDSEWRSSSPMYIPEGKGYQAKKDIVNGLIDAGECICPPEVDIVREGLMVVDGRHRLSIIRDKGKKEMIVSSKGELPYKWAKKIAP